jgi:hypothetical protein
MEALASLADTGSHHSQMVTTPSSTWWKQILPESHRKRCTMTHTSQSMIADSSQFTSKTLELTVLLEAPWINEQRANSKRLGLCIGHPAQHYSKSVELVWLLTYLWYEFDEALMLLVEK